MFDAFDTDHDGTVDSQELSSGLSVLCGGSRDEKVRAAFALYDVNGDGFIDLEEMVAYLASVFKVLFEASPETQEAMQVEPDYLARVTALQAFEEADLDHDGQLSYDEFKAWYMNGALSMDANNSPAAAAITSTVPPTPIRCPAVVVSTTGGFSSALPI